MKKLLIVFALLGISAIVSAQPVIDIGLKGGVNTSKISVNLDDYSSDNITKMHIGAFGRIGWSKLYIQPEVYFTKKGGDFSYNPIDIAGSFDYSSVDVPLLLGFRVIDAKAFDLHLMGGPVLGFMTKSDLEGNSDFDAEYFNNHYVGLQYGVGVDVLFLTLDFRMEHDGTVYDHPDFDGKNTSFMVTLGFKIL